MPYGHVTKTRFLPLSQFFLQQEKPKKGEKVIYGRQEPEKKKTKGGDKTPASTELPKSEMPPVKEKRRRRNEKEKEKEEGITTTSNVPTVPVPIGAGDGRRFLDRPSKAKKKKKDLSTRMGVLLRRLF